MDILRRGITGFDAHDHVDFRAFKSAVYAAAQVVGASVVGVTAAESVTPNFHQADLLYKIIHIDRELSAICNRHFPVIAFIERPIDMSGVQLIDIPELVGVFRDAGFEIFPAAELERPLEMSDLEVLSDSERHEARYWKPKRVADVVLTGGIRQTPGTYVLRLAIGFHFFADRFC